MAPTSTFNSAQPMLNHDGTPLLDESGRVVYRSQFLSTHPLRRDVKEKRQGDFVVAAAASGTQHATTTTTVPPPQQQQPPNQQGPSAAGSPSAAQYDHQLNTQPSTQRSPPSNINQQHITKRQKIVHNPYQQ